MNAEDHSELQEILGAGGISREPEELRAYARDLWPRGLLAAQGQRPWAPRPEAVVWPRSTEELQALLWYCRARGIPFVPFGAGSGVCGGAVPLRGGLSVDMKRMRRIRWVDAAAGLVRVECGILGEVLERALARRGLSLGHFPSSIYCSTLGGFLAARSAGQLSTRYGKIEDMVVSAEVVLPSGARVEVGLDRPDWLQTLVGSEGTMGFFTEATLRVHPLPAARRLRGLRFRSVEEGTRFIRAMLQAGVRPAVVRLYDELDTLFALSGRGREPSAAAPALESLRRRLPTDRIARAATNFAFRLAPQLSKLAEVGPRAARVGCLLILAFEGRDDLAAAEEQEALALASSYGAEDLGTGPGERWLARRYAVSYNLSKVFDAGAFADTIEVAASWDRLLDLYHAVHGALAQECFVMAHFSHAYHEGCSIYFTFSSNGGSHDESMARYERTWQRALDAALLCGSTASHHHGIGLLKAPHLRRELGAGGVLLDALKQSLDPENLSNPGKLGFAR